MRDDILFNKVVGTGLIEGRTGPHILRQRGAGGQKKVGTSQITQRSQLIKTLFYYFTTQAQLLKKLQQLISIQKPLQDETRVQNRMKLFRCLTEAVSPSGRVTAV